MGSLDVKVTADVTDLQVNLAIAKATVSDLTSELGKLAKAAAANALDQGGSEQMQQLASRLLEAKSAASGYASELAKATGSSRDFSGATSTVLGDLARFSGVASVAGGIALLGRSLLEAGDQASEMKNLAADIGLTVEQYQGLAAAAEQTGVSQETVARAIERLNETLDKARQGSAEARGQLLDIGVSLADIQGPAFSTSDLITRVGEALTNSSTSARTHTELMQLLGLRYATVANVIQAIQADLGGLDNAYKDVNGLTGQQNDALAALGAGWSHLGTKIHNFVKGLEADMVIAAQRTEEMRGQLASLATAGTPGASMLWIQAEEEGGSAALQTATAIKGLAQAHQQAAAAAQQDAAQQAAVTSGPDTEKARQQLLTSIEVQIEATAQGTQERLSLERKLYADLAGFYGADSDKAIEAQKAVEHEILEVSQAQQRAAQEASRAQEQAEEASTAAAREHVEQVLQGTQEILEGIQKQREEQAALAEASRDAALAQVQAQLDVLKGQQQNSGPSQQQVAQARQLIDQEIVLWHDYYAQLRALADGNQTQIAKINADELTKTRELTQQAVAAQTEAADKTYQAWSKAFEPISSGLATAVVNVLKGTKTVAQAFTQMAESIIEQGIRTMVQREAQAAINIALNRSSQHSDAAAAATAAAKSAAEVPFIGYVLAPIAAATVYSAAMAFGAESGFDVPAGMNPITQLHQREMVLPAPLAERVRDMTEPGGGGDTYQHNGDIHVADTDIAKMLKSSTGRAALMKTISSAVRSGAHRNLR